MLTICVDLIHAWPGHQKSFSRFNTADCPPPFKLHDGADQHSKQISSIWFESSRLFRLLIGLFLKSLCLSVSLSLSASSSSSCPSPVPHPARLKPSETQLYKQELTAGLVEYSQRERELDTQRALILLRYSTVMGQRGNISSGHRWIFTPASVWFLHTSPWHCLPQFEKGMH